MKQILVTILLLYVSGCAPVTPESSDAICDGTRKARAEHAAALAASPDVAVLPTGAALIAMIDAGCGA